MKLAMGNQVTTLQRSNTNTFDKPTLGLSLAFSAECTRINGCIRTSRAESRPRPCKHTNTTTTTIMDHHTSPTIQPLPFYQSRPHMVIIDDNFSCASSCRRPGNASVSVPKPTTRRPPAINAGRARSVLSRHTGHMNGSSCD